MGMHRLPCAQGVLEEEEKRVPPNVLFVDCRGIGCRPSCTPCLMGRPWPRSNWLHGALLKLCDWNFGKCSGSAFRMCSRVS